MTRNIVDNDAFPEIVRAPANNDFANETIIGYLAQDLADRTRWLFNRLGIGSAPAARKVDTGDGLTGGGDLTIDRTHRVLAADASIAVGPTGVKVGVLQTDAQHGNLGGGASHAAAISGGASGFMTGAQVLQLANVVASNANKADLSYVDAIAQGLDPKGSVDAIALTNLTLSGLQTVDGKSLTAGMRVGAFGQTAAADRGIYVVSAGAWTRAPDADTSAKVTTGMYTWTATGANKGGWWLTTPDPITLGTTALAFERYTFGLSSSTPPAIGQTGDAGLADTTSARGQHTHAHGAQPLGTGDNHAVATTSVAGFESAADKTKLDGIAPGAAAVGTATPTTVTSDVDAASPGAGGTATASKVDHKHVVTTAVPVSAGLANAQGSSTALSRADHVHDARPILAATGVTPTSLQSEAGTAATGGAVDSASRSDHRHTIATAAPSTIGTGNTQGASASLARADHVHAHGAQTDPTMHAVATAAAAGFQSATDKARQDLIYAQANQSQIYTKKLDLFRGWSNQDAFSDAAYTSLVGYGSWGTDFQRPSGASSGVGASSKYYWPTQKVKNPNSSSGSPPGLDDILGYGYFIELNDALPDGAAYIRALSFTVKDVTSGGSPGTLPDRKLHISLSSYDRTGARTNYVLQQDTTATNAAYRATHDVTWSGSVAIDPTKRWVLEVVPDWSSFPGQWQLYEASMSVECYSNFDAIMNAIGPHTWLRADSVTLTSGNTTALKNRAQGATDTFAITGTVAAPAADASFNGQPSLTLSGTQWATSSRPLADFKFMHDGSGAEVVHIFVPGDTSTRILSSTGNTTSTGHLHQISYTGGAPQVFVITAGVGHLGGAPAVLSVNTPAAVDAVLSSTAGLTITDNVGVGGGNFSAAYGNVNPAGTLRLWASATEGNFPLNGRWAETLIFNRVLTALERQLVREYVQARYGITASIAGEKAKKILAMEPQSWARMDVVTLASGNVAAIHDKAKHGHTFAQAGGNRIAAPSVDGSIAAAAGAFTGSQWYDPTAPISFWKCHHDGTGSEVVIVYKITGVNVGVPLSTRAGNVGFTLESQPTAVLQAAVINATPASIAAASMAYTSGVWTYADWSYSESASPEYVGRARGSVAASGNTTAAPSTGNPEGAMRIGARTGGTQPFTGSIAEILMFSRVLSTAERADVQAYLLERYGLAA